MELLSHSISLAPVVCACIDAPRLMQTSPHDSVLAKRQDCPALAQILLPDELVSDFRALANGEIEAAHDSMLALAELRGHLGGSQVPFTDI